tara:strand:+ start:178 stop:717 length:540 start_codon:yes stop_codon:yes gene_type:complete
MNKILLLFFTLFVFSCNNDFIEIKEINNINDLPVGIAKNINLVYTDSAKVKAILKSPLNKDYTNLKFPFSEFPNGIKITFFDDNKNETLVSSNYAVTYNKTNIVDLIGNVVIELSDGTVLKTSQLFWDPEQEWLFTEQNFTFKNDDYDIKANRLDANRQFTIFNTGKLDGNLTVEESEN